ncbi:hypothetical protein LXA43DRAFT_991732 [Ganoderma leucocontextum]|nr:hypothetical protein LXA43DRAFT_991732 [Ganoderma leucocontextum]
MEFWIQADGAESRDSIGPVPMQRHQSPFKNTVVSPGGGGKPQQGTPGQARGGLTPCPAGNNSSKTYSFMNLSASSVNSRKYRPRRRHDEIMRSYRCSWPSCDKGYDTLSHLNEHVKMKKHGPKRLSTEPEFKKLRKKRAEEKKAAEAAEKKERERKAASEAEHRPGLRLKYHHLHRQAVYRDYSDDGYTPGLCTSMAGDAFQALSDPQQTGPSPHSSLQGASIAWYGLPPPADNYSPGHHLAHELPPFSIPLHNPEENVYCFQEQMTLQGPTLTPKPQRAAQVPLSSNELPHNPAHLMPLPGYELDGEWGNPDINTGCLLERCPWERSHGRELQQDYIYGDGREDSRGAV